MIDTTTTAVTVRLDDKLLVITGPSPYDLWMKRLPDATYSTINAAWYCRATQVTAWRLRERFPDLSLDNDAWGMAEVVKMGNHYRTTPLLVQPEERTLDSWDHQCRAYNFAYCRDSVMLAMDMGTGKSKVVVDLVVNKGHMKTLIICPKSVLGVWRREFAQFAASSINVHICDGKATSPKKAEAAAAAMDASESREMPIVVVVNYETAWRPKFKKLVLSHEWDCVVLDESHKIKAPTTTVSKFAAKLSYKAKHRLCLTGTPMSHSPLDLFGQYRFLDPGVFGTLYRLFFNYYAIPHHLFPTQVIDWKNEQELQDNFALLAFRVEADDVLDLPPTIHQDLTCELEPKAMKAYLEMERELITDLGDGEVTTAANALVRLLRLQQITSGYLPPDGEDKAVVVLDESKKRMLAELVDGLPEREPVVVFCRFTEDLKRVEEVSIKLGRFYGELSGSRKDLTEHGTMPKDIDILGVQIQAGGLGIDLTRAAYCVYYSVGFSLGDYLQSLARTHRPGQGRTVPARENHLSTWAAIRLRWGISPPGTGRRRIGPD